MLKLATNNKYERMEKILTLLMENIPISKKELASYFSVSIRTIERDMKVLEKSYPISLNNEQCYYLLDGFQTENINLEIN